MTQIWARILLIAVIASPGIYSTLKLHPYEYIYYNSLAGGAASVANRYELDYWRISLREMALEVNELAPHGAKVVVDRSSGLFAVYARPDLFVDKFLGSTYNLDTGYDYAIQLSRGNEQDRFPYARQIALVERDGIVLATAKYLKSVSHK